MCEEHIQNIEQLQQENALLKEEIKKLKEENQKLRLNLYGIKPSKKSEDKDSGEDSRPRSKKLGPPKGHKGTSRKRPDRVDRTAILKLDACPYCNGRDKLA